MLKFPKTQLVAAVTALMMSTPVWAQEGAFCEVWAQYIWEFKRNGDQAVDSVWSELSSSASRMKKDRRLASTVGTLQKSEAYPFPSIPQALESDLDAQTQAKVRGLYDKYILLSRRIEDVWKDKFRKEPSGGSLQRFTAERDGMIKEMTRAAQQAKSELLRYGLRVKDCFPEYEGLAFREVMNAEQQLVRAQTTIRESEELWMQGPAKGVASGPVETQPLTAPVAKSSDPRVGAASEESVSPNRAAPSGERVPASVESFPAQE